jgi:hypothetical protein
MEFKVRALDSAEPKGVQQVEKELLDKHEKELNGEGGDGAAAAAASPVDDNKAQGTPAASQEDELNEEKVLSYISKRYNKQISSLDELNSQRNENGDLPEDVAAYMKYKKETGRGFEDFIRLNKDFDKMDQDQLLREYLASTQPGLDDEDIDVMMEDYSYDEELDDESHVKKTKIARKKIVAEAKNYFNNQKETYKVPLESRPASVSDDDKEEFEAYKQYIKQAKTVEEENNRKRQWFDQKTNEVFSDGFKGFEFSINDKKLMFSPGDSSELKKTQSSPSNFIMKFLDENGLMKDAAGYHRSLAVAMHPEKFAKFFYEQGMADATEGTMKNIKNINMSERRATETTKPQDGIQVKAVNPDSGRNLKIRSIKKL